jgi:hypothetical protein
MMVTVIGRGHGGTRAISQTLRESGVFMGDPLNDSSDLVPAEDLYEACRVMAPHVVHMGGCQWDFTALHSQPIPKAFRALVKNYLASVLDSGEKRRGWKLPETTLIFPWIVRIFPENHYIHWIRDPRDSVLGEHLTDDLSLFNLPYDKTDDEFQNRIVSWKYQIEIVKATPKPKHWIEIRFEDFVLKQDVVLKRLSEFLGFDLVKVPVRPEAVGRWKKLEEACDMSALDDDLKHYGYSLSTGK